MNEVNHYSQHDDDLEDPDGCATVIWVILLFILPLLKA